MKQHYKYFRNLSMGMFLMFAISSCSTKMNFATSTVVPAAEGGVKVEKDDNGNYALHLNVKRLAEPKRLQPAKSMYVVWMDTDKDGVKNLGQLKSVTGFFTDAQTASLNTVSPFKPKHVFITAEDDANATSPSSQVVLTTK
jgi:hypothetical protein